MSDFALEILDGDRTGEVIPLGDQPLRIGRRPDNELALKDEKASGRHAEIAPDGTGYLLRDLDSTNGTLLDGRKVTEVALTHGDQVQIGKIRIRFVDRELGDAGPEVLKVDAGDLARAKKGRGQGLMLVLLILVIGAGGFFYWQNNQPAGGSGPAAKGGPKPPLQVSGNRLAKNVASCDGEEGWELAVAGTGFRVSGPGSTGTGALRADGEEGAAPFAVAHTAAPVTLTVGQSVQLKGFLRTSGGGRGALRLRLESDQPEQPLAIRDGVHLQEADGWLEISRDAAVPSGLTKATVELVAVLPSPEASVWFDDISIAVGGSGAVHDLESESGATLTGTGAGIAIRSLSTEQPIILRRVLPRVPMDSPEGRLLADGLLCLSDVAPGVAVTLEEGAFRIAAPEVNGLRLVLPESAADGLTAWHPESDEGEWRSLDPTGEPNETDSVLVGTAGTRARITADAATAVAPAMRRGGLELGWPGTRELVIATSFSDERNAARELLREARESAEGGQPGKALDLLARITREVPHDTGLLFQANALRGQLGEVLVARIGVVKREMGKASFFGTAGAYGRQVQELEQILDLYGVRNLPDPEEFNQTLAQARERLQQLKSVREEAERQRLEQLAAAFKQAGQEGLEALVNKYLEGR